MKKIIIIIIIVFIILVANKPIFADENVNFELITTFGRGKIYNFSMSPTDEEVIIASSRGIWIYRISDGEILLHLEGNPLIYVPLTHAVDFFWSPDENYVAVSQDKYGVWIIDAQSWKLVTEIEPKSSEYHRNPGYAWSPDSSKFIMQCENLEIIEWDAATNTWTKIENELSLGSPGGILWNEEDEILMFKNWELYNLKTEELINERVNHWVDGAGRLIWSPTGEYLYWLFDMGAGLLNYEKNETVFGGSDKFNFSHDGKKLGIIFSNNPIYKLDLEKEEVLSEYENDYTYLAVGWSSKDDFLGIREIDGHINLINMDTEEVLFNFDQHKRFILLPLEGNAIFYSIDNQNIELWDPFEKSLITSYELPEDYYFYYTNKQGIIGYLNKDNDFAFRKVLDLENEIILKGPFKERFKDIVYIDHLNLLITTDESNNTKIWDLITQSDLGFDINTRRIFMSDDKTVAMFYLNDQGDINFYDLSTLQIISSLKIPNKSNLYEKDFFISPLNRYLVSTDPFAIWDINSGQKNERLSSLPFSDFGSINFSNDENYIIFNDRDSVNIWDISSDEIIFSMDFYISYIKNFFISPDTKYIAYYDGSEFNINIYSIKTQMLIDTFFIDNSVLNDLFWDENFLYVNTIGGTTKIYQVID